MSFRTFCDSPPHYLNGTIVDSDSSDGPFEDRTASKKNNSKQIKDVKIAVDILRSVLLQVPLLLLNHGKIDHKRVPIILVEEVVVTLIACVMTFSDLVAVLKA